MRRVRLIHWRESEVDERAARLAALGWEVDGGTLTPARYISSKIIQAKVGSLLNVKA